MIGLFYSKKQVNFLKFLFIACFDMADVDFKGSVETQLEESDNLGLKLLKCDDLS